MGSEFLQKLGLSQEEYKKLAKLGAPSPAALLAMRSAAQERFDALVGKDRADEIAVRLESQLTPEERERLTSAPPAKHYPLGAMLGTATARPLCESFHKQTLTIWQRMWEFAGVDLEKRGNGRSVRAVASLCIITKLEKRAGVVQWQYRSFPSFGRGFDSHRPLHNS